ncbi:MAG: arsenate reductase (glutaredoxin) [Gammaproteobacteria bacterium]
MSDQVTIFHNPRCSKSRSAMALLEDRGTPVEVIKYLDTPPSADELKAILKQLDMGPRELLRKGETEYKELNLADPSLDDEALIQAMVEHPKLIERPIVIRDGKAIVARPPERVGELF